MRIIKLRHLNLLFFFLSGILLNSCDKTDESTKPNNEYLISGENLFSITSQEAKIKLTFLQILYPETAVFGTLAKEDISVQKLVYKTSFQNKSISASGLVCMPKTAGNYPILCFQNGTNTLHSEAPTENPKSQLLSILESVASMGFIVVIPDYIGFGSSANLPHPYLHAESSSQCILDLLRAVREFGNDEKNVVKPNKDLFIFGYSQGGWATMQLQKTIEKDYSSEFNLLASSCAAGPYSIEYMNESITQKTDYPMPYFLTYLLNAYVTIGLVSNPVSDFVQAPYAAKISGLYDGKHSGDAINKELTTKMADLITPEYRTQYATNVKFAGVRSAFAANSIAPWLITTPTRLYHGGNDEYIPVSLSEKMLADFKTKGVSDSKIKLEIIPGFDHSTGVIPVGLSTIQWFLELKK